MQDDDHGPKHCTKLVFSLLVMLMSASGVMANSEFEARCKALLPAADSFYQRCEKKGVPFGQTFYPSGGSRGEDERYRVLFFDDGSRSHFILGCVLAGSGVKMVSIYYKSSVDPLPPLKPEHIRYADLQGHVGLSVDGERRILLAIRQIVTDKIPARYEWKTSNCGASDVDGNPPDFKGPHLVRNEKHQPIGYCYVADAPCAMEPYVTLFGIGINEFAFKAEGLIFVDVDGSLMVPRAFYAAICQTRKDFYGPNSVILESCP